MSSTRWNMTELLEAIHSSLTIAANATTAFDFGTPNDIDLRETPFEPGDRLLVILTATRAAGTANTLEFSIQDAPDNAGNIGTPGTAVTAGTLPSFATDSGAVQKSAVIAIKVQHGRPWLRINATHDETGTDSFTAHVTVLGVPSNV